MAANQTNQLLRRSSQSRSTPENLCSMSHSKRTLTMLNKLRLTHTTLALPRLLRLTQTSPPRNSIIPIPRTPNSNEPDILIKHLEEPVW